MCGQGSAGWMIRMRRCGGGGLVLLTAVLANGLLFYALAAARIQPALKRVEVVETVRFSVMNVPSPDLPEPALPQVEPEFIGVVTTEPRAAVASPLAETSVALAPRLPGGIREVASFELPGLAIALPGRSDLRVVAGPSISGVDKELSLSSVDEPPRLVSGVPPRFPRWARRARLAGAVMLRFVVTAEGTVGEIRVRDIEGDERFGPEAVRAVTQWRFAPATKEGQPVPCWCFQKINFELEAYR